MCVSKSVSRTHNNYGYHVASLQLNKSFRVLKRLPNTISWKLILPKSTVGLLTPFFFFDEKNKSRSRCPPACPLANLSLKLILSESNSWIINSFWFLTRKLSLHLGAAYLSSLFRCCHNPLINVLMDTLMFFPVATHMHIWHCSDAVITRWWTFWRTRYFFFPLQRC